MFKNTITVTCDEAGCRNRITVDAATVGPAIDLITGQGWSYHHHGSTCPECNTEIRNRAAEPKAASFGTLITGISL